ncbi:MAG: DUF1003 domain-containing protein [Chlamydiia bacterium]|nr:DUF1003 domain-containing protein [Chlamydiia bacterium]
MKKEPCQICKQPFSPHELYPISLIRSTILDTAKQTYPDLSPEHFVCFKDLRKLYSLRVEAILQEEIGELSDLEKEVVESIHEQDLLTENISDISEQRASFGERLADTVASIGGSWSFILSFFILIVSWMGINSWLYSSQPFDPYPYILLNLVLSCLAAIQAPIIMMSQNRQAAIDRLKMENDYQVNLKAELQIRHLNQRIDTIMKYQWQTLQNLSQNQQKILDLLK